MGEDLEFGGNRSGPIHSSSENLLCPGRNGDRAVGDREEPALVDEKPWVERVHDDERTTSCRCLRGGPVQCVVRGFPVDADHDGARLPVSDHLDAWTALASLSSTLPTDNERSSAG
jgi:hypothetical protein